MIGCLWTQNRMHLFPLRFAYPGQSVEEKDADLKADFNDSNTC
jgi:hypothetical protein